MSTSNITLIHGDCLIEMQKIPDKSIDMILCDLPYEVLHKNNPNTQWDKKIPFEPLWEQYERIIKAPIINPISSIIIANIKSV